MTDTILYVVTTGDFDEYRIAGVFTDADEAVAFRALKRQDTAEVGLKAFLANDPLTERVLYKASYGPKYEQVSSPHSVSRGYKATDENQTFIRSERTVEVPAPADAVLTNGRLSVYAQGLTEHEALEALQEALDFYRTPPVVLVG